MIHVLDSIVTDLSTMYILSPSFKVSKEISTRTAKKYDIHDVADNGTCSSAGKE